VATDDDWGWDDPAYHWPQWRGPLATGVAPHGNPPVEWSETKNVRWKTTLPGRGHSTPIVWQDRVYLTDREGTTLVVSHEEVPQILAANELDDTFSASAAIAGRELFLRGQRSLYCIAAE
jgi:hypothetical protein